MNAEAALSVMQAIEIDTHIETQQVETRIAKDENTMTKIDLLVGVLQSGVLDSIGEGVTQRKLEQLIKRL